MWNFIIQVAIAVAVAYVSYLLAPKPKSAQNPQSQSLREPTAEAGKPVPVVFGEVMVTSPNVLYYGDVRKEQYEVKA